MIICETNPCGLEYCPYLLSDIEPPDCEKCGLRKLKESEA